MKDLKFYLFLITIFVSQQIFATSYYVSSKNGNDNNSGTSKETPFKTVTKATSICNNGDSILLLNGVYQEEISITKENISIIGIEDSATITGTDIVNNWMKLENNKYVTYLPTKCTQVFVDSKPIQKAKYPNGFDQDNLFNKATININYNSDTKTVTSNSLNQPDNFWKDGTIWMIVGDRWVAETGKIISSTNGKLTLDFVSGNYDGDGVAYITNTINALDSINEWYWQNDSLYLITDKDISTIKIEAKTRETIINLNSRDNITISNINGFAGNVLMNNTTNSTIEKSNFLYLNEIDYLDKEKTSWLSSYSRGSWTSISSYGIGIGVFGENNTIDSCNINWSAGDGITLYGKNNIVKRCNITNGDYFGTDCAPLSIGGEGNRVILNNISNGGRETITALSAQSFLIKQNRISHCGLICWDVGLIYTYDTDGKDSRICYNWLSDANSGNPDSFWGGEGVYLDNNSRNYIVDHNVIWNIKGAGVKFNSPAINLRAYNNTIFNSQKMMTYFNKIFVIDSSKNCKFYNNYTDTVILNKDWLDAQNNIRSKEDYLTDRENMNFIPKESSPLIGGGINVDEIGVENGCDIGAYQPSKLNWSIAPDGVSWSVGPDATELETTSSIFNVSSNKKSSLFYPNPINNMLHIQSTKYIDANYKIVNIDGICVKEGVIKNRINISNLPKGNYLFIIESNKREAFKFYKTK